MGEENNECIIATTWDKAIIIEFRKWLDTDILPEWRSLFVEVPTLVNGKTTIILAPCGSKKGWRMDEEAKIVRFQFVRFLESFTYEDGSSPFNWVEVGYGEFGQSILQGNCTNLYSSTEYEGE